MSPLLCQVTEPAADAIDVAVYELAQCGVAAEEVRQAITSIGTANIDDLRSFFFGVRSP